MPTETSYEHIVLNEGRVPLIANTTMKVVELVLDHVAYGWSPEELHFQHPHLTMGQIHSALAYYWDHRDEIEAQIAAERAMVDELQANAPSLIDQKLTGRRAGATSVPA